MSRIAIDGPGASGKSTLARRLSEQLGAAHLDTGAMYRVVALLGLRRSIDPSDGEALAKLASSMDLQLDDAVIVDGEDVTTAIRSRAVDAIVSEVAAHKSVRAELVKRQRNWIAAHGDAVIEGRDIGTVVLPDADLKIFLVAAPDERAKRRAAEQISTDPVAGVREAIASRDEKDSNREHAPLRRAVDAVELDTTSMSVDEEVDAVLALLAARR